MTRSGTTSIAHLRTHDGERESVSSAASEKRSRPIAATG